MFEMGLFSKNDLVKKFLIQAVIFIFLGTGNNCLRGESAGVIKLPEPAYDSQVSLEQALLKRRSVRDYRDEPLRLEEISQLLWAAQGITDPKGLRTAPSAGALYPLEIYLLAGKVTGLAAGSYRYLPQEHGLANVAEGDKQAELSKAALSQGSVKKSAAVIVICAVYERTAVKYGERAERYAHIEVGSVAQNIYLQAVTLNLGTVFIGAFRDDEVRDVVNLENNERPLCLMPVGRK